MRMFSTIALVGAAAGMAATALAQVPKRPVAEQTNAGATIPSMTAQLLEWNGTTIPAGQQCKQFGGNGSTPRIAVSNYHAGAQAILLALTKSGLTREQAYKIVQNNAMATWQTPGKTFKDGACK